LISTIAFTQKKTIDQKVDSVLKLMTLDEKVGQMNQYNGPWEHTGPITEQGDLFYAVVGVLPSPGATAARRT